MVAERTRSGPVSVYGTRVGMEEASNVGTEVGEVELELEAEVEGEGEGGDGDGGDGVSGGQVEF